VEEELITSDELAHRLKTTTRFVRRLVAEHRIEYIKVGRCVRFTSSAIAAYVERNRVCVMSRAEQRRALVGE
jgi:excisionase family DNA binding protein